MSITHSYAPKVYGECLHAGETFNTESRFDNKYNYKETGCLDCLQTIKMVSIPGPDKSIRVLPKSHMDKADEANLRLFNL